MGGLAYGSVMMVKFASGEASEQTPAGGGGIGV